MLQFHGHEESSHTKEDELQDPPEGCPREPETHDCEDLHHPHSGSAVHAEQPDEAAEVPHPLLAVCCRAGRRVHKRDREEHSTRTQTAGGWIRVEEELVLAGALFQGDGSGGAPLGGHWHALAQRGAPPAVLQHVDALGAAGDRVAL